ncbi:branched-chain-amino-acid aminotransferase, cytosolic isoform X1 [Moschus berezovskii]|uniref:branched-chain-amino-acid aminotransferase, cytosolic isoform X1 n=2 Tax=Moschus berezovskii TaxID=68408 RepID=UPI00244525F6|nr:branched-chain-amino-acid aminotransferase, cytosolic isoform X1 [Moschus berezovskii]
MMEGLRYSLRLVAGAPGRWRPVPRGACAGAWPLRPLSRGAGRSVSPPLSAAARPGRLPMASPPPAAAALVPQDCNNGCSAEGTGEGGSKEAVDTFKAEDLIITRATVLKEKPDPSTLVFGTVFTDHMLTVEWSLELGWEKPRIKPLQNLSLHPGSSAFHYAVELFEGLKAFRGVDNKIRLFRPNLNMDRMYRSAMRATLPAFDKKELLECIQQLVKLDEEWVPYSTSASLYIRPTFIGTEPSLGVKKPTKALLFVILSPVGPYFSSGSFNPVSLWANPKYVRAWKGGTGDCKMGGNYGSSLFAQREAVENACQQVLWLYGEDNQITEVGTMNLFLYWINEDGEEELATPPLDGIILPGVTRQSILDLAHKWGEFKVSERYLTMDDLTTAVEENRVREMFGSGTACVVCPVSTILYKGETIHIPTMENGPKLASRILERLTDIQYGREESDWTITVA